MYSLVSKNLLQTYKDNNKPLIKLVTMLALFLSPVLLLFAPLPGYLLYTQAVTGPGFAFAMAIFTGLTLFSAYLYDKIHQRSYLLWLAQISSYQAVTRDYCLGQLKFALSTHLLLLAGLTRIEQQLDALLPAALVIGVQLVYFRYRFYRLMNPRKRSLKLSFIQQLLLDLGTRIVPHAVLLTGLLTLMLLLVNQAPYSHIALGVALVLMTTSLILIITAHRIVMDAFYHYRGFIRHLSKTLDKQLVSAFKSLFILIMLTPMGLLAFWVIEKC